MSKKPLHVFESRNENKGQLARAAILAILALAPTSCEANGAEGGAGRVTYVVDGDTFDVEMDNGGGKVRVRLWGVDCPETRKVKKCTKKGNAACEKENEQGKDVKAIVQNMLDGARVTLEPPFEKNGNRTLAYVRLSNGEDLSRKLIESCLCHSEYKHQRKQEYRQVAKGCRGK